MKTAGWRLGLVVAALCAALAVAAQDDGADEIVVEGDPPLTVGMAQQFLRFFEWVLEAPFTVQQRELVARELVEAWVAQDAGTISATVDVVETAAQIAALDENQQDFMLTQLQPAVLEQLRASAPEDEGAAWLLAIYDAAHVPIAEGTPPLTRQVSDAYAEVLAFMIGELLGQPLQPDDEIRQSLAESLVAEYAGLAPEGQAALAQMPQYWAALRVGWSALTEEEREAQRAAWREQLGGVLPTPEEIAAARAEAEAAAQAQAQAQAQEGQPAGGQAEGTTTNWGSMAAMQMYYQTMSNVMESQRQTMMIMSSNIGGNTTYRYSW